MKLINVLEKLAVIAPERFKTGPSGSWTCIFGETTYRLGIATGLYRAAITWLMFSEMRDVWNGPRAMPDDLRKSIEPIFLNKNPRHITDELIWETYLAWIEARKESQ